MSETEAACCFKLGCLIIDMRVFGVYCLPNHPQRLVAWLEYKATVSKAQGEKQNKSNEEHTIDVQQCKQWNILVNLEPRDITPPPKPTMLGAASDTCCHSVGWWLWSSCGPGYDTAGLGWVKARCTRASSYQGFRSENGQERTDVMNLFLILEKENM